MKFSGKHILLFAALALFSVSCEKITGDWSEDKEGIDLAVLLDDSYYVTTKADRNDRFYNEAILQKDNSGNEVKKRPSGSLLPTALPALPASWPSPAALR